VIVQPNPKDTVIKPDMSRTDGEPIPTQKTASSEPKPSRKEQKFRLIILIDANDEFSVTHNGKNIAIGSESSANVKYVEVFKGEKYIIKIGNCEAMEVVADKNQTLNKCI
jgi:hypothetical protein